MVWDHEVAGSNPVTRTDWLSQSMLVFSMQVPISLGACLTTSEGAEIMRSEFDDKLRKVKAELAKAKDEKLKAEREKQRAEDEKLRAEEEKILTAIDLLVELKVNGKEIENELCEKFSMTKNDAAMWIRRYAENKTKK